MKDLATGNLLYQCVHSTKITSFSKHYHIRHELIYVIKGRIEITVGDSKYIASDNQLVFLSNLEEHSTKILSGDYDRIFLILNSNGLDNTIRNPLLCSVFKTRPNGFRHVCSAPPKTNLLMASVVDEYNKNDEFSAEICGANLKQLLVNLYRETPSMFTEVDSDSRIDVFAIQKHLENNYKYDIKISDVAEQFYISPYYLSHVFKNATGYSPKQYLTLVRLTQAKVYLLESTLSVEDIAQSCGFVDSGSLIRCFKQEYNITPKQFRINYKV